MSDSKAGARPFVGSADVERTVDHDILRQGRDPVVSRSRRGSCAPGRFAELDIEHLADEIEDVGKSEKREFASRMAVLLAHLLKWSRQPEKREQKLALDDR